jgi:hypothetical protein
MDKRDALIREAAQWLLIQRTLRPLSQIAKDAGMSVNQLKYHAKKLVDGGATAQKQEESKYYFADLRKPNK